MNTFVNNFRISVKEDLTEAVFKFYQESPEIDANGKIVGTTNDLIASLVMAPAVAKGLAEVINELLPSPPQNN